MSARDELIRAARHLEAMAAALPPDPWYTVCTKPVSRHPAGEWVVDSPDRLIAGNIGLGDSAVAEVIAEHVSTFSPDVSLAIAAWLRATAERVGGKTWTGSRDALTVARSVMAHAWLNSEGDPLPTGGPDA